MSPEDHQKFTRYAPFTAMGLIALIGGIVFAVLNNQHSQDARTRAALNTSTVSVGPMADAPVYSKSPTSNYGTKAELQTENDPTDGGVDSSYLKFSLAPFTGTTLSSVKLRLQTQIISTANSAGPVSVKWVPDTSWTESGITYNNKPAVSSTTLGAFSPTANGTGYEVVLNASFLQSYVGKTITLALTTTNADAALFESKESYSGKPALVVAYTTSSTTYGPTPTPTKAYAPTPTPTKAYIPTPTPTKPYVLTPTPTKPYLPTPTPTKAPTPTPTKYLTPTPTKYPTLTPTKVPTLTPTKAPTPTPTKIPTPTVYNASTPTPTIYKVPTATPTPFAYPTPTPTSPPKPTSTPIPYATTAPGSTAIAFTLGLHGLGNGGDSANPNGQGNMTPLHPQRAVSVEVYDASNALVNTQSGFVAFDSASGFFKGVVALSDTITTGSYTVKVKTDQFLRTVVPGIQNVISGQTLHLAKTVMVTGDINNDNQLNILDYNILSGCYSDLSPAVSCAAGDEVRADITDDGAVNQFDYNLFLRELTNRGGN